MSERTAQLRRVFAVIHDVLIHEWDPIGVGDVPQAQDEYDSYIWPLYGLIRQGADDAAIAAHLQRIETDRMGLAGVTEPNQRIARRLREVLAAFTPPIAATGEGNR